MALARWDEAGARTAAAIKEYERVVNLDPKTAVGGEAVRLLDRIWRKQHEWSRCVELWESELGRTTSSKRVVRAHIELAKLYERRMKQAAMALEHAEQAVLLIDGSGFGRFFALSRPALEKQIIRLQARVGSARPRVAQA